MSEAGVYVARGISELDQTVRNLAEQGFRIINVFEAPTEHYNVVAQKENTPKAPQLPRFFGTVPRD